jgi:hypothetical protein
MPHARTIRQATVRLPATNHVQPRSKKITNKMGIGMPNSQRRMYPIFPDRSVSFCMVVLSVRRADIQTTSIQETQITCRHDVKGFNDRSMVCDADRFMNNLIG